MTTLYPEKHTPTAIIILPIHSGETKEETAKPIAVKAIAIPVSMSISLSLLKAFFSDWFSLVAFCSIRVTPSSTESIVFWRVSKSSFSLRLLSSARVFVANVTITLLTPLSPAIASSIFIAQLAQSRSCKVYFLVLL